MAISWMKKGEASARLAKQQAAEAQKQKEEQGKMFRFWLKEGEEASVTFVDGALSDDGFLLPARFWEHNLFLNNQWNNYFVCPEKTNPESGHKCPICESGDKPSLITVFTIIDHRTFKGKNDKVYTNTRKILAAKPITFELLNKIALKRGGLAGCTFDVSRIGDKAAAVGSMFDFTSKEEDLDVLREKYTFTFKDKEDKDQTVTAFEAADYEKEIIYRTEDELRKLGFGNAPKVQMSGGGSSAPAVDYSKDL